MKSEQKCAEPPLSCNPLLEDVIFQRRLKKLTKKDIKLLLSHWSNEIFSSYQESEKPFEVHFAPKIKMGRHVTRRTDRRWTELTPSSRENAGYYTRYSKKEIQLFNSCALSQNTERHD